MKKEISKILIFPSEIPVISQVDYGRTDWLEKFRCNKLAGV
jgi:hypothetical protein